MDRNILNILLEYKKLEGTKNEFYRSLNENNDLTGFGVTERSSGIINSLNPKFLNNIKPLFEAIGKQNCYATAIRGLDKKAEPYKNNSPSFHVNGTALDIIFTDKDCYCTTMNECAKQSKLFCQDLRMRGTETDWNESHLHISPKYTGANTIPCSSTGAQNTAGNYDTGGLEVDTGVYDIADKIGSAMGFKNKNNQQLQENNSRHNRYKSRILNEDFNLGNSVKKSGSEFIIPADKNKKLYSPIDGKIISIYDRDCTNGVVIMSEDGLFHLKYCNLKWTSVDKGDDVTKGTLLGRSGDEDVVCTLLNSSMKKTSMESILAAQRKKKNNSLIPPVPPNTGSNTSLPSNSLSGDEYLRTYDDSFGDPGAVDYIDLLLYPFTNRYDQSGRLTKKNWGSPTEKRQPDKFAVINKLSGNKSTDKSTSSNFEIPAWIKNVFKKKKVDENINRIKKLLN